MTDDTRSRFMTIGTSTGEATIDLQRVAMIRIDGDVVVLTLDVGPMISAHAGASADGVYCTLVDAWKLWIEGQ
jgi:hypothetical protein